MTMLADAPAPTSLLKRLDSGTDAAHSRLDQRVMASQPFASVENLGRFLKVQHQFHRDIDGFYKDPALALLVPDLLERRRLDLMLLDAVDLGVDLPAPDDQPVPGLARDTPTALGWLYVAEGSKLGAASLLKRAAVLGLDETRGVRHLGGHPGGRGLHWRQFTGALEAMSFSPAEEEALIEGACAAFRRVHALAERFLPA